MSFNLTGPISNQINIRNTKQKTVLYLQPFKHEAKLGLTWSNLETWYAAPNELNSNNKISRFDPNSWKSKSPVLRLITL